MSSVTAMTEQRLPDRHKEEALANYYPPATQESVTSAPITPSIDVKAPIRSLLRQKGNNGETTPSIRYLEVPLESINELQYVAKLQFGSSLEVRSVLIDSGSNSLWLTSD